MITPPPYIASPEQQRRDYVQRTPPGYVPRPDPLIVLTEQAPLVKRAAPVAPAPKPTYEITPEQATAARKIAQAQTAKGPRRWAFEGSRTAKIIGVLKSDQRPWPLAELAAASGETVRMITTNLQRYRKHGDIVAATDPETGNRTYQWIEK